MYVNALSVHPHPGSATKVQRQSLLGFSLLSTVQQVRCLLAWRLEPRSNNYNTSNYQQKLTCVIQLHNWVMRKASSWWGVSITRSVNTPLPAPWQHSWECRMFTCLETVYLTTNLNISLLHLVRYICIQGINLLLEQNFNMMCCFLEEKALKFYPCWIGPCTGTWNCAFLLLMLQTSIITGVRAGCQRQ